jgi:hypothetical protein
MSWFNISWIRDMCDCESTRIDLDNKETIKVLKTIYRDTKTFSPIGILPPTDSSEEESEDDDYEPPSDQDESSDSDDNPDEYHADSELEEEPISITTNEEFIVKRTEQGFWYLW